MAAVSDYTRADILEAYARAGVKKGRVVYVTGNFGRLGRFETPGKQALFNAHLDVLRELLGEDGTIVVPTHSFSLAETGGPFDLATTPSESGSFAEFVRRQAGSVRQYHPFSSSTALGREACAICGNCSRHVYGLHTPFQRMLDRDALFLSVGKELNRTISLVHHAEFMMGVPYRYVKEFSIPCIQQDGDVRLENFYLHVWYRACSIERDRNQRFTTLVRQAGGVSDTALGRAKVSSVSMSVYFDHVVRKLRDDIYAWLREAPTCRPYRQ